MNALGNLLLRREAGIFVMIVLFCAAVGAMRPRFISLDELRIILLLVLIAVLAVKHDNKKHHVLTIFILLLAVLALYYAYKVFVPSGVEIALASL